MSVPHPTKMPMDSSHELGSPQWPARPHTTPTNRHHSTRALPHTAPDNMPLICTTPYSTSPADQRPAHKPSRQSCISTPLLHPSRHTLIMPSGRHPSLCTKSGLQSNISYVVRVSLKKGGQHQQQHVALLPSIPAGCVKLHPPVCDHPPTPLSEFPHHATSNM